MHPSDRKVYHFHAFQGNLHIDGFIECGKVTGSHDYPAVNRVIAKRAANAGMDPQKITIASLTVIGNAQ